MRYPVAAGLAAILGPAAPSAPASPTVPPHPLEALVAHGGGPVQWLPTLLGGEFTVPLGLAEPPPPDRRLWIGVRSGTVRS